MVTIVFSELVIKHTDVFYRPVTSYSTDVASIGFGLSGQSLLTCRSNPPAPAPISYHSENGSMPWGRQQACHSCLPWLGAQQLFTP